MTDLNFTLPTVGQSDTTEEPLVRTALSQIKTTVNGNLDGDNLLPNTITSREIGPNSVTTDDIVPGTPGQKYGYGGGLSTLSTWTDIPSMDSTISTSGLYIVALNGIIGNVASTSSGSKLGLRLQKDVSGTRTNITPSAYFVFPASVPEPRVSFSGTNFISFNVGDKIYMQYYTTLTLSLNGSTDGSASSGYNFLLLG